MKFRKKPVVIEAQRLTIENYPEIASWIGKGVPGKANRATEFCDMGLRIRTLEGWLLASWGDWVICGVKGEFYACKPDIFEQTYEPVREDDFSPLSGR